MVSFPCRILRSARQRRRVLFAGLGLGLPKASIYTDAVRSCQRACPLRHRLRDATSPKVRGLGSPPSFPVYTSRPAAARGAVRRCAQTSRLCQGLPLWGSWQSRQALTERARMLAGRLRPSLAGTCGGAKSHPPPLPPILPLSQKNIKILLTSGN